MNAIREEGKINEDTTLIDVEMLGQKGLLAMYLIEGGKKCLIDGGISNQAQYLIDFLAKRNAFPPDVIILTHAHWDHTQAIPSFRKKATELGKIIEVMASKEAIPLLNDQSFNDIFNTGPYEDIDNVIRHYFFGKKPKDSLTSTVVEQCYNRLPPTNLT